MEEKIIKAYAIMGVTDRLKTSLLCLEKIDNGASKNEFKYFEKFSNEIAFDCIDDKNYLLLAVLGALTNYFKVKANNTLERKSIEAWHDLRTLLKMLNERI
nr:MAG TPA: hypothetical protein [Caudoviricetes sp.]